MVQGNRGFFYDLNAEFTLVKVKSKRWAEVLPPQCSRVKASIRSATIGFQLQKPFELIIWQVKDSPNWDLRPGHPSPREMMKIFVRIIN